MDFSQAFHLLRRRWRILLVVTVLGAGIGYGTTLTRGEEVGPVITYWAANEVLVLNQADASAASVNLERIAVFVTGGEVPAEVAAGLGGDADPDELVTRVRTVSDFSQGTLTVSAVSRSAEESRELAQAFSAALQDRLNADGRAQYDAQLAEAVGERDEREAVLDDLDDRVQTLNGQIDFLPEGESLPQSTQDLLTQAQRDRDVARASYVAAVDAVAELEAQGPPQPALLPLESVPPFQVSEKEFGSRVAQGRQGENNFTVGDVELADTSRTTVSERLRSPAARGLVGALGGLLLAAMAVLIHFRLDPRLRDRDQVEEVFGLPVLAEIPVIKTKKKEPAVLHAADKPRSQVTEAYRAVRSGLLFASATMASSASPATAVPRHDDGEVRVLMVTSPGPGEGKTTTSANLAVTFAEHGYDTVLINCDHRRPRLHEMFGIDHTPGISVEPGISNLRVITDVLDGTKHSPAQMVKRQRAVIERARALADVVVLDTAPLLATNDTTDLLPVTDLVVMVVREGRTTRNAAAEARTVLVERMRVPVAGVVITAAGSTSGRPYYDRYRYGHEYTSDAPALQARGKARVTDVSPDAEIDITAETRRPAELPDEATHLEEMLPSERPSPSAGEAIHPTDDEVAADELMDPGEDEGAPDEPIDLRDDHASANGHVSEIEGARPG